MALVFFGFFLVFFGFFWHWFWPEFEIGNWFFLVFFGFFWFFFGIGLGQHSKLETGFLGSVGFFWFFLGFFGFFLVFKFRVRISSQKIPKKTKKKQKKTKKTQKKNQKKPVATPKLVNWLGFFWFFFGFFWFFLGEHPPPRFSPLQSFVSTISSRSINELQVSCRTVLVCMVQMNIKYIKVRPELSL